MLSSKVNSLYTKTLLELPKVVGIQNIKTTFNSKRKRIIGSNNKFTYEGYLLCGAMCHIINTNLDIQTEKYIYKKGYGKYYEDHVFLRYGDYIIDPTYRQMFRSYCGNGSETFYKILYESNEPFFVGKDHELFQLYDELNNQHIKDFGEELENKLYFYSQSNTCS